MDVEEYVEQGTVMMMPMTTMMMPMMTMGAVRKETLRFMSLFSLLLYRDIR